MAMCTAPVATTTDRLCSTQKGDRWSPFSFAKPWLSGLHPATLIMSDNQHGNLVLLCYIEFQPVPAKPCRDDRAFSFAEAAVATVDPSLVDMFGGASSPPTFLR